ncbi:MAG: T9SS type A sorting domain-containing protein, partial [Candidatus Marinimicrobia bacterium]|nr:T9SS type A sorting domain-containing protein [Candidatus Neomarinimicrobiota bacterium]
WGDPPDIPVAPSNLAADDVTASVVPLYWVVNSDTETGIYVYQNESRIATLAPGTNDYVVEQLLPATTYNFAVSAFNDGGESPWSNLTITTLPENGNPVFHFTEDFEFGSTSNYLDGVVTLESGDWSAYQAGNFTLGTPNSGIRCLTINDDQQGAHITTPPVNTLGTISFYYYQRNGATTDEFQLQKSDNGAAFELVSTHSYNVGSTYTLFSAALNDTSSSVRVRVVNDNQPGHLIIDDLTVTQYDPVSIDEELMLTPGKLTLSPAYPNPFNPEVTLSFQVNEAAESIQIQIIDIQGQLIDTPIQNTYSVGAYSVTWDGTNRHGEPLPSGIYLVKLSNSQESLFQRITLLR